MHENFELLISTDDIPTLARIFSNLGRFLLESNIPQVIKCETMYGKIVLVLSSGLQSNILAALNLIYALQNVDYEKPHPENKTLQFHAKDMIRISGCLSSMNDLFINCMMIQENWKALCFSISKTCENSFLNQSHCSHLVPLCIEKCRSGNLEPVIILQSLLQNHYNLELFHKCNGMKIFIRDCLPKLSSLQPLNLVIYTKPDNKDEVVNSANFFDDLFNLRHKFGSKSSIGQWASIILFSYRKVVGNRTLGTKEKDTTFTLKDNVNEITYTSIDNIDKITTVNDKDDNTSELFRNIILELNDYQRQNRNEKLKSVYDNKKYYEQNLAEHCASKNSHKFSKNSSIAHCQYNNICKSFQITNTSTKKDSTFLSSENLFEPICQKPQYNLKRKRNYINVQKHISQQTDDYIHNERLNRDTDFFSQFKPPFASTPKGSKIKYGRINKRLQKNNKRTLRSSPITRHSIHNIKFDTKKYVCNISDNKGSHNRSMSAKFLDIVNRSCTTLMKGFSTIKNIFSNKNNVDTRKSKKFSTADEENSFTNYMRERDARLAKTDKEQDFKPSLNESEMERNSSKLCLTCNDTMILENKLANDAFLQETVKKLKMGINLYGCDFKKISRSMWPEENYMTPIIIYNLYRKLIIKK